MVRPLRIKLDKSGRIVRSHPDDVIEIESDRIHNRRRNPRGRYDRCVADVSRSGSALNPYAVCAKTLKPRRRKRNPTVLRHAPLSEAQMSERVKREPLGARISADRKSIRFDNGEQWVWDQRFSQWVMTHGATRKQNRRRHRNVTRRGPGGELFSLVARKSNQPPMVYTGDKFARHGKPVLFQNLKTAKAVAAMMQRQYPALRAYSIWARSL